MITVRRGPDRLHLTQGRRELWHTFGSGAPEPEPGFGTLAEFDEERLPPGKSMLRRPTGAEGVALYLCDGMGTLRHQGMRTSLASGSFVHHVAAPDSDFELRNASRDRAAHVFRIGLVPGPEPLAVAVDWNWFGVGQRRDALRVVASPDGRSGSLNLGVDAEVHSAILRPGRHVIHEIEPGHGVWLHIVVGSGRLGPVALTAGDGASLVHERAISFTASEETEVLMVTVPL